MEDLLKPDYGVMTLTICNFLLLVYLLKKFAWDKIIGALETREKQVADDKQSAQEARQVAEKLKKDLEEQMARISEEASKKMSEMVRLGETQRDQIISTAKEEATHLLEQAKAQIEVEKNQALAEVRGEIVKTAMLATERMIKEQMTESVANETVDKVLAEIKAK